MFLKFNIFAKILSILMAFLGTKELLVVLPGIIDKPSYDPSLVDNVAYQLCLGNEVYLTDSVSGKKELLNDANSQVVIRPGQFALLLTRETLSIPDNILAFISIKFTQKIKGLVNISGFHVDPGFKGKIIFSVYNAGPAVIKLDKDKPYFLIWFSQLTSISSPYAGIHKGQKEITAENISALNGELASPSVLLTRFKELETKVDRQEVDQKNRIDYRKWLLQGIIVLLAGLLIKSCNDNDALKRGYEDGLNMKTVTDEVRRINIDSLVNAKADSIIKLKTNTHDTAK